MVLVGGFAESQYLQTVLLSRLKKDIKQINIDEATYVYACCTMQVSREY